MVRKAEWARAVYICNSNTWEAETKDGCKLSFAWIAKASLECIVSSGPARSNSKILSESINDMK